MENLSPPKEQVKLFNGPIETGIRSLVILDAAYPKSYDINELVWFDHLIVHSEDIGGPPSLHPKLPQRTGEVLVKRSIVQDGLRLMQRAGLISIVSSDSGVLYQATDDARPLVNLLQSEYLRRLKQRADWLATFTISKTSNEIKSIILDKIGNWEIEFQGETTKEVNHGD